MTKYEQNAFKYFMYFLNNKQKEKERLKYHNKMIITKFRLLTSNKSYIFFIYHLS